MPPQQDQNPYEPPAPTEKPDEERFYQLWEASFNNKKLKAKFFVNGQLKVYVNEDLVFNETKWLSLRETVDVRHGENHIVIQVKSNLFTLSNTLTVDEREEDITKTLDHTPEKHKAKKSDNANKKENDIEFPEGTGYVALASITAVIIYYIYHYFRDAT